MEKYTSALFEIEVKGVFDFGTSRQPDVRELIAFRRSNLTREELYALLGLLPSLVNKAVDVRDQRE